LSLSSTSQTATFVKRKRKEKSLVKKEKKKKKLVSQEYNSGHTKVNIYIHIHILSYKSFKMYPILFCDAIASQNKKKLK